MARPPHILEHDGRQYEAWGFDDKAKTAFAKWAHALYRDIERDTAEEEGLSQEQLQENLNALRDLYAAGDFSFLGQRGQAISQTPAGAFKVMCLIFRLDSEEMTRLSAARPDDVVAMMAMVLRESFGTPDPKKSPDPNVKGPKGYLPPARPGSKKPCQAVSSPPGNEPATPTSSSTAT